MLRSLQVHPPRRRQRPWHGDFTHSSSCNAAALLLLDSRCRTPAASTHTRHADEPLHKRPCTNGRGDSDSNVLQKVGRCAPTQVLSIRSGGARASIFCISFWPLCGRRARACARMKPRMCCATANAGMFVYILNNKQDTRSAGAPVSARRRLIKHQAAGRRHRSGRWRGAPLSLRGAAAQRPGASARAAARAASPRGGGAPERVLKEGCAAQGSGIRRPIPLPPAVMPDMRRGVALPGRGVPNSDAPAARCALRARRAARQASARGGPRGSGKGCGLGRVSTKAKGGGGH